jgi:hypothetical protein
MDVMGLDATRGDEIVPHEKRERQVREPVLVQVAELASAEAKFSAAE